MEILFSLFWFGMGAIFGSAANALLYRLPKGMSWTKGHSICPSCKHQLGFWDLIPLLSFLSLRGKCRYCKKDIGWHYFFIELITAASFVLIFNFQLLIINQNLNLNLLIFKTLILSLIFWVMMIIAIMDWKTKLISDAMVISLAFLVTIFNFVGRETLPLLVSGIFGVIVGVGMIGGIWLFTRGRAMGSGDIELQAVLGWGLGWEKTLVQLWMAFVLGSIYGGTLLVMKKLKLKSEIAFGPFLILGAIIAYGWGDTILTTLNFKF